ncbi:MAG: S-layer homology domain-containing protein [Gaiellales bacterium]|nr:S-layer homology domain-containing protein [Gaiellales bacterium]
MSRFCTVPGPKRLFADVLLFLTVLIAAGIVAGALSGPAEAVRPGEIEPAAGFSEWRDDEIYLTTPPLSLPVAGAFYSRVSEANGALSSLAPLDEATHQRDAVAAAAGHFLSPGKESIAEAFRNGSNVEVRIFGAAAVSATLKDLAGRAKGCTDFLDIAAGDLDGLLWDYDPTDDIEDSAPRDEVVVAYARPSADGQLPIALVVLDFGTASESLPAASAQVFASASGKLDATSIGTMAIRPMDNALAMETADFDSDGRDEIAVAYLSAPGRLTIDVFRLNAVKDSTGRVTRSLQLAGTGTADLPAGSSWFANLSSAAGDFDGEGRAELALGTSTFSTDLKVGEQVRVFRFDGSGTLTVGQVTVTDLVADDMGGQFGAYGRVQVAAGLFTYDPATGFHLGRRQLAVAYALSGTATLRTIQYGSELNATLSPLIQAPGFVSSFSLAAGRFQGADGNSTDPSWSVVLTGWKHLDPVADDAFVAHVYRPARGAAPALTFSSAETTSSAPATGTRLAVVAVDRDGDSLMLGVPVHFTVEDLVTTDYVIQEPPKHAFWDQNAGQIVNVNRTDDFFIELLSSTGGELSTSHKQSSSYVLGSSEEFTAGGALKSNVNIEILNIGNETALDFSSVWGREASDAASSYNSTYVSVPRGFTARTSRDDLLFYSTQVLDIWRYRIYGLEAEAGVYPFVDFVVPGPMNDLVVKAAGLDKKWYQPVHENGNILSYPQRSNNLPEDLGSYTLPGGSVYRGLMYGNVIEYWNGTYGSTSLEWSSASGGGSDRSLSHTLKENSSLKMTAKVSGEVLGSGLSASASYALGLSENSSWGDTTTRDSTLTNSVGFRLQKPPGVSKYAYAFYPSIYATEDGTIKATYAVDPLASDSGEEFWLTEYGQKKDLALNLPSRFFSDDKAETGYSVETGDNRKKIRGFFVRQFDERTGTYFNANENALRAGEPLTLQVRVYNYAVENKGETAVPAGYKVRFSYIPFSTLPYGESGSRQTIGEVTINQPLLPQQYTTVSTQWTPVVPDGVTSQSYRVYVELDPDNMVDEKYETEPLGVLDPGQNNEGWVQVTVGSTGGRQGPLGGGGPAHVGIPEDGVVAIDAQGETVTGQARALVNEPLQVGVTVASDKPMIDSAEVMLFDGDPDNGGELIAMEEVFAGDPEGTTAWFSWTPSQTGTHRLHAKVLQGIHDAAPGNNTGVLDVSVAGFSDVPSTHANVTAINELAWRGVILGTGENCFGPGETVIRQQFAKMIVKGLGLAVTGSETSAFTDVEEQQGQDPFYPSRYVAVCVGEGITVGTTLTTFAPYDAISHEQLITMIARAANLPDAPAGYIPEFVLAQFSLEEHYVNAVKAGYAGLLDGLAGMGVWYDFQVGSTRGECAQILYNLILYRER